MLRTIQAFNRGSTLLQGLQNGLAARAAREFSVKGAKTPEESVENKDVSYTYEPPGCSISDPVQLQSDEKIHFYDSPPAASSRRAPVKPAPAGGSSKHSLGGNVLGQPKVIKGRHSIRMADDYSSQPYVVSNRGSMTEPAYVSISDPTYVRSASASTPASEQSEPRVKFVPGAPSPRTPKGKHPYKMTDDYAQQSYVYSVPRGSMKEPTYVSISDP